MSRLSPNRLHAFAVALTLGAALSGAVRAHAQADDAPTQIQDEAALDTAAARGLFEQGMEAVDAGDYSTAADRLSRSLAIRESVVARTNLGMVLIELGRLVEASEHFRRVMRDADVGSPPHDLAEEQLGQISGRLGRLRIETTGEEEHLEVQLDGRVVDENLIGVPQPADPGAHRVSLHRLGREIVADEVLVELQALATITLEAPPFTDAEIEELEAMEDEDVQVVLVESSGGGGGVQDEWWFWTLIGVLVVGAGVGIALGIALNPTITYQDGSSDDFHHTALVELEF